MASGESKIFVAGKERILILLLCIAAAFCVFIFSAAFPFFSNIDEDLHFDLITQYSHAQVPRSFDRLREETLNWIVPYASPEFCFRRNSFQMGSFQRRCGKSPGRKWNRRLRQRERHGAAKSISNHLSRRCITHW